MNNKTRKPTVTRDFNSTTVIVSRNGDGGRDHLGNQDVDEKKILKQDLDKQAATT
jgi:hypothetical protein